MRRGSVEVTEQGTSRESQLGNQSSARNQQESLLFGAQSSSFDASVANRGSVPSRWSVGGRASRESQLERLKEKREQQREQQPEARSQVAAFARDIVENRFFIALTTTLTIFALCGDDIRLACTEKTADIGFDSATIICLVVFSVEVVLSCLGKDDYFQSFFFYLDAVSTTTLLLDITAVNAALLNDEEDIEDVGSIEAAQLAKAGRVVRVLRLVRILKLYKTLYEAQKARQRQHSASDRKPGDEDDWDDIALHEAGIQGGQRESRVGKKLSDMTTRRVIILVLLLLGVLPFLTADEQLQLSPAPLYGADVVHRTFQRHLANGSAVERVKYELALLEYIYYHNWFTATRATCPGGAVLCSNMYLSQLFWVGIVSREGSRLVEIAKQATIERSVLYAWEANVSAAKNVFNFGSMPDKVLTILSGRWDAACAVSAKVQRLGMSLLEEKIAGFVTYAARCPENLRSSERVKYTARLLTKAEALDWHFAFYFDIRPLSRQQSIFGLMTTAFVTLVLTVASIAFSNDANTLVLYPVEQMISKVEIIRDNPLNAIKMADDEFKVEEMKKAKAKQKQSNDNRWLHRKLAIACGRSSGKPHKRQEPMETVVLEKTIIKLGSLLALGFGEAGANIIEHNMHGVDSACVDAMIEGNRVECIIGCTRIRDFSIVTEVLQKQVMSFVNQIAEIVHGVVDEFHGAANKNHGDMFLVVWHTSGHDDCEYDAKIADMSMLAFVKVLAAVHSSYMLSAYRAHPGLQHRLGRRCRVNLSFGLHFGWSIEGAVGSEFKIDASYLSPNVSIAESVENATIAYGVSIIVADSVISMCSPAMAAKCRRIDRVIVTGSRDPMDLYVIDMDYMALSVEQARSKSLVWSSRQRFRARHFIDEEKSKKRNEDVAMVDYFSTDPNISAMRFRYTQEFSHVFHMGFQNYLQGEWKLAKKFLSLTKGMLGVVDGPSEALLKFMETPFEFEAPATWNGTREFKFT